MKFTDQFLNHLAKQTAVFDEQFLRGYTPPESHFVSVECQREAYQKWLKVTNAVRKLVEGDAFIRKNPEFNRRDWEQPNPFEPKSRLVYPDLNQAWEAV